MNRALPISVGVAGAVFLGLLAMASIHRGDGMFIVFAGLSASNAGVAVYNACAFITEQITRKK